MNENQKRLTSVALATFICLIVFDPFGHGSYYPLAGGSFIPLQDLPRFTTPKVECKFGDRETLTYGGELNDSGVALVVLAVVYPGLFFMVADKRNKGS